MDAADAARAKAEEEEAAKWINMISVEQEGTGETDVQEENQVCAVDASATPCAGFAGACSVQQAIMLDMHSSGLGQSAS